MNRRYWARRNALLDPVANAREIYRTLVLHEFPWDMNQALSFALFRTYAVPSIGDLLDRTGEFTGSVQKRYDDTGLLLEAPLLHGFDSDAGRVAVRRINQMHRLYDISQDDFRYVLSTFVVVPKRWNDDFGWRRFTDGEVRASVEYYRTLGRHMAITDIPATYQEFADLMDSYEAEHFAFHPGSRRVADATLALMQTFYPSVAAAPAEVFARALMDRPLLDALGYEEPSAAVRAAARGALKARAVALRAAPARRRPKFTADLPGVRSYPQGYDLGEMGTFAAAPGCPVPHAAAPRRAAAGV